MHVGAAREDEQGAGGGPGFLEELVQGQGQDGVVGAQEAAEGPGGVADGGEGAARAGVDEDV